MEYTIEILKYIGPFIGVLIGWFLNSKSEKKKIEYDESRKIKRILFILLEIRNELLQPKKIDKYLRVYIEKVKSKFDINEIDDIDYEQLRNILKNLLIKINGTNNQFDLYKQFNECIDNLSEIDPILAYRINGKQNIRNFIESWENETISVLAYENINEVESMISHFKPKLIDDIQYDLSIIIKDVAKLTDDSTVLKETSNLLKEPTDAEYENDITEFIDKMFNKLQ